MEYAQRHCVPVEIAPLAGSQGSPFCGGTVPSARTATGFHGHEPKKIAPPLRSSHSDESRCSGSWKSHAMELETVWGVKNLTVLSGLG